MYFDTKSTGNAVEILASNDYQAIPLALTETDAVLAGAPITASGEAAYDGADAIGILLYDVDPARNPNAAVVVDGIIDWGKCMAHNSDITADMSTIASALPNITFRDVAG